jgi:hypothetical protein
MEKANPKEDAIAPEEPVGGGLGMGVGGASAETGRVLFECASPLVREDEEAKSTARGQLCASRETWLARNWPRLIRTLFSTSSAMGPVRESPAAEGREGAVV